MDETRDKMNQTQIMDYVRRIRYRDGWSFRTRPHYGFGDGVVIEIEAQVANSSPRHLDSRPFVVTANAVVIPIGTTESQIRDRIFKAIMELEEHEAREFFKVDGRAPFHPHRSDGEFAWIRSTVSGV